MMEASALTAGRTAASPWARLNLRWNPFGEPPPEEAASLVVLPEAGELASHLERPAAALQLLGRCGRGKTARLRHLQARFPTTPYLYLPEDGPLPTLPRRESQQPPGAASRGPALLPTLLLDEAQRLPRHRRRRLFRSLAREGAALALAAHRDLTRELESAGLAVRTQVVAGLRPRQLQAVLERRLEWSRRGPGPLPDLEPGPEELIERFGDDLRSILDHLYERWQEHLDRALLGRASSATRTKTGEAARREGRWNEEHR